MKKLKLILLCCCLNGMRITACLAQHTAVDTLVNHLHNIQDYLLPEWGPYSKRYAGVTHIADKMKGITFDVVPVTGFYRGKIVIPNNSFESDFHPWTASPKLDNYSFREDIAWKDKVYADIHITGKSQQQRLMTISLNNHTPNIQYLGVNLLASINYPDINPTQVVLPANRKWLSGINYEQLIYAKPRPDDNLRPDGLRKGEKRGNEYVFGSGLGDKFGTHAGDQVSYNLKTAQYRHAYLLLRYEAALNSEVIIKTSGLFAGTLHLKGTGQMEIYKKYLGKIKPGNHQLKVQSLTDKQIEIDGLTILEQAELNQVKFFSPLNDFVPGVEKGKKYILLKYANVKHFYGIAWHADDEAIIRDIFGKYLDVSLRKVAGDNVYPDLEEKQQGHFENIYIRPVVLPPNSTKTISVLICQGSQQRVRDSLNAFSAANTVDEGSGSIQLNQPYINHEGIPYQFSYDRLSATLLQNIIFPIYKNGQYVNELVGGKRWASLYTWDSGFIGLGLSEINIEQAVQSLNAYTTSTDNPNAFVQHGSMVPVQFFLLQELWNKTQSKKLVEYFYPRLRRYYLFYTGQYGSSTINSSGSGMLRPFDYFYNSGGWDDYPAQVFVNEKQIGKVTAPVISSAMAIRIAKIMSAVAGLSGNTTDLPGYEKNIATFTNAIQQYSWDKQTGYFGYVSFDKRSGKPIGILRTPAGENYNKGLDGIYPLIAGICTPEQQHQLLGHLFNPNELWTPAGISAVDQSASYFSSNGYWNGAVWFAHQWFIWKTMLDIGQGNKAYQIAKTALNLYKNEVDSSYNCYELFRIATNRGNGWHQFSSLSSPILNWFSAYFKPGTITTGLNGWVMDKQYKPGTNKLAATLQFGNMETQQTILICMSSNKHYLVTLNGARINYKENIAGVLEITVPPISKNRITLRVDENR